MDSFRQEKVQRFEEFVHRRLKPDLVKAIAERDKVFEQQKVLYPFLSVCVCVYFKHTWRAQYSKELYAAFGRNELLSKRNLFSVPIGWIVGVMIYFMAKVFGSSPGWPSYANSDLRRNIENLQKNSVTSLRTLVNLGSEVYMQADVPDTQRVFVDVGLGFHVEFTWPEALNFISLREEKLTRQIEEYTRLIASIKAQIKLVCEGIRELLQLPAERSVQGPIF